MKSSILKLTLALLALSLAQAKADPRRYGYTYESTTMPKGEWEYEQWFTWQSFDGKDRYDFRHELEYGLTDRFQLALYLVDWRHEEFDGGESKTAYKDTALEAIYNLSDPNEDLFGSALYGEVKLGDKKFALEGRLIAEKNFGRVNAAYNFLIESEWEGDSLDNLYEKKGEFENDLGVSYQFSPRIIAGVELVHAWELEDWKHSGDHSLSFGPNISWRKGALFVTLTALWDLTDADGAANNQVRLLAGFDF